MTNEGLPRTLAFNVSHAALRDLVAAGSLIS